MVRKLFNTSKIYSLSALYVRCVLEGGSKRLMHNNPSKSAFGETDHCKEATVLVEKDSNITLIGINRPQQRNTLNAAAAQDLCAAINAFESDVTSPAAVLYGIGGTFSAGKDVVELNEQMENGSFERILNDSGGMGPTRRHLHKPIVCAINGYCVAGGLELALLCDLRVMEDTAKIGFYGRNSGMFLYDSGTARLPAIIGLSRALDLVLTGRSVSAEEALQMGLINRLVATGTALGQAVNLAFSVAKFPLAALHQDRTILYRNCFERRKGFKCAMERETVPAYDNIRREMRDAVKRFIDSRSTTTDAWHIKHKWIPDWEREEIEHERRSQSPK